MTYSLYTFYTYRHTIARLSTFFFTTRTDTNDPYGDDSTSSTFVVDSGSKAAIEERPVHSADTSSEARCVKALLRLINFFVQATP